jgi:hypothetical protein
MDDDEPDEFDRVVVDTFQRLKASDRKVRPDVLGLDDENSPASVGAWLFVADELGTDSDVLTYSNPTEEELRVILVRALEYSGDWYHSRVTLCFTGEWSRLEEAITELPASAGVFLSYSYASKEAMLKHFGVQV